MNRPPNKHHSIGNPAVCMKEFGNSLDNLGMEFSRKINELGLHFQSTLRHVEGEMDRLKQKVAGYSFDAERDYIYQRNEAANITAKKLREIAETGQHIGTFGGEEVEKAAQAILKLSRVHSETLHACRNSAFEEAAVVAENWGNCPQNPGGRRAALAREIRALKKQ